ncbi:hypothetical protein RDV89_11920 [Nocardioides zeae]|uniref:DUF308 domain-containing protein n=1 Tax=Nocardioides imazamoxiresistens TaxID=3231893 RepID=A0ABU3PX54_9ACTN|nr:hypothetical protein [Nocardioides zeae]MDT9593779.1 hypothetical protein [Nocardioides zeae]
MNRGSDDEAWRAIVENFGERARLDDESERPGEPAERPDDRAGDGPDEGPGDVDLDRIAELTGVGPRPDQDRTEPVRPDPEEERFVPPPPPPLPRPSPGRLVAWLGVLGAPVLLVLLLVLQFTLPAWFASGLVIWFLGGFAYLVTEMPRERPDDGDNGARV